MKSSCLKFLFNTYLVSSFVVGVSEPYILSDEVGIRGYVDVDTWNFPLSAAETPGNQANHGPALVAIVLTHERRPAVASARVVSLDSSGADEGRLVQGEVASEAGGSEALLAGEGVDHRDLDHAEGILEPVAGDGRVAAPARHDAPQPLEELALGRQAGGADVRSCCSVDGDGEVQESDVVGEGLGVELRVHDDAVDEHVSMGVQGGVLGRREVQLAQTRDEVSLRSDAVSRRQDPLAGDEGAACHVPAPPVEHHRHPGQLTEQGCAVDDVASAEGVLSAAGPEGRRYRGLSRAVGPAAFLHFWTPLRHRPKCNSNIGLEGTNLVDRDAEAAGRQRCVVRSREAAGHGWDADVSSDDSKPLRRARCHCQQKGGEQP